MLVALLWIPADALPFLAGGGSLLGLGGLIATLYLLRANRDDTISRAAKQLVEGASHYNEDLQADLRSARRDLRDLKLHTQELTREMAVMHRDNVRLRSERDHARSERDAALYRLGEPPAAIHD